MDGPLWQIKRCTTKSKRPDASYLSVVMFTLPEGVPALMESRSGDPARAESNMNSSVSATSNETSGSIWGNESGKAFKASIAKLCDAHESQRTIRSPPLD